MMKVIESKMSKGWYRSHYITKLPTHIMNYYTGNPSKIPYICIV